jgi:hypothetical protein
MRRDKLIKAVLLATLAVFSAQPARSYPTGARPCISTSTARAAWLGNGPAGSATPACPANSGTVTGTITSASVVAIATQNVKAGDFDALVRQHAVVADRARELDEAVLADATDQRLHGGFVDPMLAHELAREVDDLRVLRRNAPVVILADCRDGRLGHAESPHAVGREGLQALVIG